VQSKQTAEKDALFMEKKARWLGMIVSDPMRRSILRELVHGTSTPSSISRTLEPSVTSVARSLLFLQSQGAVVCDNPGDVMAFVRGLAEYSLSREGLLAVEYMKQDGQG
jgi:hypothetical protein